MSMLNLLPIQLILFFCQIRLYLLGNSLGIKVLMTRVRFIFSGLADILNIKLRDSTGVKQHLYLTEMCFGCPVVFLGAKYRLIERDRPDVVRVNKGGEYDGGDLTDLFKFWPSFTAGSTNSTDRPPSAGVEARSGDIGVKKLPFYGGALGRYLLIEPDGRMKIVGERRPPNGPRDEADDEGPEPESGPNDTISVSKPPENASVSEAKPVAVAIAGHGGTASAKPIATAVVGPHGLAVAQPIATAIAGVDGAENLVPHKQPPQQQEEPIQHRLSSNRQNNIAYGALQPQTLLYYSLPVY